MQLFSITKLNCCDITDLISNTLGGACGYGLYMLFRAPLKHLYALLPGGELSFSFLPWPRFVRSNTAFMLLIILFVRSAAYCFLTL